MHSLTPTGKEVSIRNEQHTNLVQTDLALSTLRDVHFFAQILVVACTSPFFRLVSPERVAQLILYTSNAALVQGARRHELLNMATLDSSFG